MNKKIQFIIISLVVGGAIFGFYVWNSKKIPYELITVQKGDIVQTVSASGKVEPPSEIKLRFKNSGKLMALRVKIGDEVVPGEILAEMDMSQLKADMADMQAGINLQKAKLSQLLAGNSKENINLSEANIAHAKSSYASALENLDKTKNVVAENIKQAQKNYDDIILSTPTYTTTYEQAIRTAQTSLENVIKTNEQSVKNKKATALTVIEDKLEVANIAHDNIQKLLDDENANYLLSVRDSNYLNLMKNDLNRAESELLAAKTKLATAQKSQRDADIDDALDASLTALNLSYTAITYCYQVLENTITSSAFSQNSLDAYKSAIGLQRSSLSVAISAVQNAKQNLDDARLNQETNLASAQKSLEQSRTNLENAKTNYFNILKLAMATGDQQINTAQMQVDSAMKSSETAKAQLEQLKASARPADVAVFQAQINQAETALQKIAAKKDELVIVAPLSGVVTGVNGEVGENISPDSVVVTLASTGALQVKLNVVEDKIVNVHVGQKAKITFDAIGNQEFGGKVVVMDLAETIIGGAVYYQTTIFFDKEDERIRSGMTANIWIETAVSKDVLFVPVSAIQNKDGKKFVKVLAGKQVIEKEVVTGLKNDVGMIEIVSGLVGGEQIILGNKK